MIESFDSSVKSNINIESFDSSVKSNINKFL